MLPQKLSTVWKRFLKVWVCSDPTELHQRKLHVLGNLTVTAYNPDLSNKSFADKKSILRLKKHKLELSAGVFAANKWNEAAIDARSLALAEQAIKHWRRP